MINHFASLLLNTDFFFLTRKDADVPLNVGGGVILEAVDGIQLTLSGVEITTVEKAYSAFLDKDYSKVNLPIDLKIIHDILFPPESSDYYKQFLLYCYLRLIDSTDKAGDILKYDNRVTYKLSDFNEYFRLPRLTVPYSSDGNYSLLVNGKLEATSDANYFVQDFVIRQISNTANILVYSPTQKMYYKSGKKPSQSSTGMEILLEMDQGDSHISRSVPVGDTGLYFKITGPLEEFLTSESKIWSFSAEAPFRFNLITMLNELDVRSSSVANMLNFSKEECDSTYENMWAQHYNSIYRFVGFLLAYVERVNLVWQRAM